jgi:hypothetical protein
LPFQIGDLLLGIGDLLFTFADLSFALGNFTAEFFVLSQQPLIFTLQLFPAGLGDVTSPSSPCLKS